MMTTMASADMQRSVESTAVYNKLDGIFTLKEDETTAPLNFCKIKKPSPSLPLSLYDTYTQLHTVPLICGYNSVRATAAFMLCTPEIVALVK